MLLDSKISATFIKVRARDSVRMISFSYGVIIHGYHSRGHCLNTIVAHSCTTVIRKTSRSDKIVAFVSDACDYLGSHCPQA